MNAQTILNTLKNAGFFVKMYENGTVFVGLSNRHISSMEVRAALKTDNGMTFRRDGQGVLVTTTVK